MTTEKPDPVYKYVDGKIKLIKRDLQQFKQALEQIEDLGFQDQITSLDKKLNQISNALSDTRRLLAQNMIETFRNALDNRVQEKFESSSLSTDISLDQALQFILTTCIVAIKETEVSQDPIPIAEKFRRDCTEYCRSHKINLFIG